MFGWGENRRIENREKKIEWKMAFSTFWFRRENKRDIKWGKKINPPGPHFFILPIWEENGEEKMLMI